MLTFHGDAELAPGLVDLAVNVRPGPMPDWLAGPIAASLGNLTAYPDDREAQAAVAARYRRPVEEVLLTAGAAQAYTLLAQAPLGVCRPVVVHPQFTETEAALAAAGHRVERALLAPPDFAFDPAVVPGEADLVVIGNPTNPTSVAHPAGTVAGLAEPGRLLVVDEAFADTVPGEPGSLASRRDVPGLLVLRSFTKTWGLAGLRIGYLLGPAEVLDRLRTVAPLWPVSTPALAAAVACASDRAVEAEREIAVELAARRVHLVDGLRTLPGVAVAGTPSSSFVLVQVPSGEAVRLALRTRGFAVRRGDTFPGLGPDWLRVAVRETAISDRFLATLEACLADAC